MIIYKIQNLHTKLFVKKKWFYLTETSRWDSNGTCWNSIEDIAKYLKQFCKYRAHSSGVDISDWQIVEYTLIQNTSIPAYQSIQHLT